MVIYSAMNKLLPHPGEILKPYFVQKKELKPLYSLRALARDLNMSPAFVSQILSQKRTPSMTTVESFVRVLKVRRSDATVLRKAVLLHSVENKDMGKILNEYIRKDPSTLAFQKYSRKNFEYLKMLTKWHQLALLELITCEAYQTHKQLDERFIAQKLQISIADVRESLLVLSKANLIESADGKWRKKELHIEFPTDTGNEATIQYHKTMTTKALEILTTQNNETDILKRRIIGATLAVNPQKLNKVIDELNKFLFKISSELSDGQCSEVYQINLQLFPLTKANK